MLNHMEMISHDTGTWQRQLHSLAEGRAHIHTYSLDRIAVAEPFEQVAHFLFVRPALTSSTWRASRSHRMVS